MVERKAACGCYPVFLIVLGLVRVLNSVFFSCESPRPAVVGMVTVHTC